LVLPSARQPPTTPGPVIKERKRRYPDGFPDGYKPIAGAVTRTEFRPDLAGIDLDPASPTFGEKLPK
jgi:hypothetical protein